MNMTLLPRPGRIIAVASGKGGVGKTWFAISLAQALAGLGRRVLLVDADFGLANIDVQLGLGLRGDLGDVLAGRLSIEEAVIPHPAGFAVLPGRSGSGALANLDQQASTRLVGLLRQAAAARDDVILDLAAGIDPSLRRLASAADMALVLATDEPTSLTDAYAVLKLHRQDRPGASAQVVVNQADSRAGGERTWQTLDRACLRFLGTGVPLAGVIRRDPRVPESIRRQTPVLTCHPTSPAAEDVRALANMLAG